MTLKASATSTTLTLNPATYPEIWLHTITEHVYLRLTDGGWYNIAEDELEMFDDEYVTKNLQYVMPFKNLNNVIAKVAKAQK